MQGLLLINKPEGITSFGSVARIKRIAGEKRVGHTGTLDPMATGVLPIFIGRATALSSHLLDADKEYVAKIKLGVLTDSCDITGTVTKEFPVNVTKDELLNCLNSFLGKQKQIPPMFSAIKKDGVRLYELARKGETIDIPPRDIEVYSVKLLSDIDSNSEFSVAFKVSKGTYIRSLCRDIGYKLGCGAVMSALCRTYASGIELKKCVDLDSLDSDNISSYIINEELAVSYLPEINVTHKQAVRFCNGGQLDYERLKIADVTDGQLFRVKCGDAFLGLGIADNEKRHIAIKCIINYI